MNASIRCAAAAALALLIGVHARAADNAWTNAAANATWNTTSANWTAPAVWNNANVDSAIFGAVGSGPVAVTVPVTARGLQFNATSYSLTGSTITLAAGGGGSLSAGEIEVTTGVATIDNVLAGSVGLTKTGSGRLALSSVNTYSGGTTISDGALQLQNGGNISGNVTNNAALRFANTAETPFAGNITGTGEVNLLSIGTVTLTGAASHTGGTSIGSLATLQIGAGGTVGSLSGDVENNGVLRFNRSDVLTYAGNTTGAGQLQKQGAGSLRITGTLGHTGGTTVSGGTLQIGVAGTTGSISGDITNNSFVAFNRSDNLTYGGVISGTGILSHSGNSVLTLTGNHTYSGETRTDAGSTLSLGNGGTTGEIVTTAGSPATIVTNGVVRFNRSDSLTFFGSSAGTGSIEKQGTGTLNLIGNYAHTGGTTISSGIVTLGTGATTGTLAGNVTNNALFIFQNSTATTYAGTLTGTGTVSQNGSTLVTITGALNHTGPTNVGGSGGLAIGNGGTAGSISANINVSSFVRFNRSDILTYAGNTTGSGQLQKQGAGSLRITGSLGHTGGTTVSGGTLQIGVAGTTGSISGNITNNAFVAFNRSDNLTYGGVISGTGILSHSGNSVLTLTGNHTYTGETRTDAGSTLSLGNGGTTGGILATAADPATIVTNGVVRFNRSDSLTFFGSSAGTGSIEKQGTGTLNLIGNYAHTGGTTVSAGILTLGTGATTGTLAGNVTNNALFIFQNSTATTYTGTVTGTGTVSQNGSTLVTITGALNHTGPTNVGGSGGLSIGSGGSAGSISSNINVSSFVRFNRSNALAYGGAITGAGDVQKNGGGTLTLSGVHTYNGDTVINAGTLALTGGASIASTPSIVVASAATLDVSGVTSGANFSAGRFALASGQTLTGRGTVVGDLGVRNGATLAAGGSPGTTSVTGDVDFDPGSTFGIQLSGATDADVHRSRLALTGALTFAGSIANPLEINVSTFGGFTGGAAVTYTIASAGSIGSTGLNSPLILTLGAGGSGSALNANLIRLSASGFDPGDQFTLQRVGSDLRLSFVPSTLAADFDGDGDVDVGDLAIWKGAYKLNSLGDADGDNDSDGADFLLWQRQLGSPPSVATLAEAPEPGSGLLGAVGILGAGCKRRRSSVPLK
jgi:autotransporter-associated beta strand protein